MDGILTTARDLELEVNEDDIEKLIMGHEDELKIEELQESLNEEHQEIQRNVSPSEQEEDERGPMPTSTIKDLLKKGGGLPRRLPSTAIDALAKNSDDVPVFLLVIICIAGTLLILINGAIVACYMQRRKKRQTQGYQVSEAKGPPYGSSMYSRDKYHDTINGEALRSPLNDVEETFHEDILMKEIMKQEAEPSKSPKIEHKVPTRAHQNHQRWPSAAENSCPDILKNGHNYVKVPIHGRWFAIREDIANAVHQHVTQFTHDAANAEADSIRCLPHRWQCVVTVAGDYIEGL
ncbi:uncharacterized protein TNCV_3565471 [Trichonephila clavipes]|nr:uncharacterized protein TNCV_3565471 [Trichonephila clavipes]